MMLQSVCVATAQSRFEFSLDLDPTEKSDAGMLQHLAQHVCYEPEVTHLMLRVVEPGDYVIDVGASVGFFTILLSRLVGDAGHVLAFEPGFVTLTKLKNGLRASGVKNVDVCEQPLWTASEKVTYWVNQDSAGGSCLWDPGLWFDNPKSKANPICHEMQATTLDAMDDLSRGRIKLIKLDTEGTEQRILEGADKLLKCHRPSFIVTELNPFGMRQMGCSAETFRDFMSNYDYQMFLLHPEGALPALVPARSEVDYQNGCVVMNALFSTVEDVGRAWPKVPIEWPK